MLCTGPHQTEEPGERSGDVSSDGDFLALILLSDIMTCLKYSAQQHIFSVCVFTHPMFFLLEFPGSCQAWVKRRAWRSWTQRSTWPTWSPRPHPSTWASSAWTKRHTRTTRNPWIPRTARERWTGGVYAHKIESVCVATVL